MGLCVKDLILFFEWGCVCLYRTHLPPPPCGLPKFLRGFFFSNANKVGCADLIGGNIRHKKTSKIIYGMVWISLIHRDSFHGRLKETKSVEEEKFVLGDCDGFICDSPRHFLETTRGKRNCFASGSAWARTASRRTTTMLTPGHFFSKPAVASSTVVMAAANHLQWVHRHECPLEVELLPPPPKVDGGYVFTSVCLSVSRISQKVMDGFIRNLVKWLGVWKGRIDSILVKIRMRAFLNF